METINTSYCVAPNPHDGVLGVVPTGTISMFAGPIAPFSFLFCNGALISRNNFGNLFQVIGTTYGAGDGATTFALPNLNSRVVRGLDATNSNYNTLGETGGTDFSVISNQMLPNHSHSITDPGHFHQQLQPGGNLSAPGVSVRSGDDNTGGPNTFSNVTGITINQSVLDSAGIQTFQPPFPLPIINTYIALNYIIKT